MHQPFNEGTTIKWLNSSDTALVALGAVMKNEGKTYKSVFLEFHFLNSAHVNLKFHLLNCAESKILIINTSFYCHATFQSPKPVFLVSAPPPTHTHYPYTVFIQHFSVCQNVIRLTRKSLKCETKLKVCKPRRHGCSRWLMRHAFLLNISEMDSLRSSSVAGGSAQCASTRLLCSSVSWLWMWALTHGCAVGAHRDAGREDQNCALHVSNHLNGYF